MKIMFPLPPLGACSPLGGAVFHRQRIKFPPTLTRKSDGMCNLISALRSLLVLERQPVACVCRWSSFAKRHGSHPDTTKKTLFRELTPTAISDLPLFVVSLSRCFAFSMVHGATLQRMSIGQPVFVTGNHVPLVSWFEVVSSWLLILGRQYFGWLCILHPDRVRALDATGNGHSLMTHFS